MTERRYKTIPECRDELRLVISRVRRLETKDKKERASIVARIYYLLKHMTRRKPVRKALPEHRTMTPAIKRQIRAYAKAHPAMSYTKIGRVFHVNAGRVSEAIAGKRR
mgnify:CR=1 FL=1